MWFELANVAIVRHRVPRHLVTLTASMFGLQAHPAPSSSFHRQFSVLVSLFVFTIGSCNDVTPVVTDLLR